MAVADTAVGAILEIPPKAMAQIKRANDALLTLHETSVKTANQISGDFGRRMPDGVQKFIDKLAEAKKAMDGLGTINVTLNTGAAVTEGQKLSTQMHKTSSDVSKAVQDMSSSWNDLGKVNIKGFNISDYGNNLTEVLARLTQLKQDFKNEPIGSGKSQAMADEIRQLEEAIRLYKQAAEEKNKALANIQQKQQSEKDKAYLDEQKRLLERILQLRKDISQISISVQRGTITGKTDMSADLVQLEKLRKELRETGWAYRDLRTFQSQTISEDARIKAEIQSQNAKNAGLRQEVAERNKLNAAITRANELTAQGQQGKSRLGSGEEASIQRQLNSDYKNQLAILKEIGEIKAKAAEQGKKLTINSAEIQLIQALAQRYRVYAEDVNRVAGAYRAMGEAAAKNFAADRSEQLARNAIMLADAQKKAEGNTKQLTAEYKRLYAENQRLFESQRKYFNEGGGTLQSIATGTAPQDQAYRDMEARRQDVLQRMGEIERKNIQEIADFRLQKEMEANQKIISDLVQAEAQKKAAAEKSAQEQADAQKRRLQEYLQTAQGAMWQARQVTSGKGTGDLATNLENIKRAINDLKAASGNLNLLNPADVQKAEQLKKKIAELETLLKKYKDAATPDKPVISPQDAINAAKNATTLKQLEKAYKDLKEAMSGVDSSKPIWSQMNTQLGQTKKQIDDIKKKMGEFHSEVQKTSNIMGQLQSRIAAAFSVGAIMGFAKKVTEVRAQFELQRVALGAIIQDKDEANKIFLQVQQMALESPFSIMQLERSTKQIAAFGFEAKQLVPTMKMVADIGAGLGVELDRIVLVLGHMKARGYLEGTMVRQFTNMGFNVLGELAKYYTELEGRMVSVADVQERVKKKMVEFGDVEEVLKRVTSAGGMFYDMQKKQSDSIWGQMQRITDAYDLMLNEIGQSNEGSIKAALTAIRTLINSWRTLAPIIVSTVASVGSFFTVSIAMKVLPKVILGMSTAMQLFRRQITIAEIQARGLNNALLSNPYAAITAAVVGLGFAILQVATAQSKLNEELERTQSEGISDMYGLIFQYRTLADTVKDSTKSYDERKKALDELGRVYKDVLPDYMTELNYIKSITDGYKYATDAIKAYSEAKIRKNMQEAVENEYGKQIQDAIAANAERFSENVYDAFSELPQLEKIDRDTFKGAVSNIMTGIAEEIKAGTLPIEKASDELQKRVLATFNISKEDYAKVSKDIAFGLNAAFKGAFGDVNTWWSDIFGFGMKSGLKSVIMDMNEEMGKITNLGLTSTVMDENAQPAIDQYHNLEKAVSEYTSALEALYNRKAELEKQGGTFGTIDIGEVNGKQTLTFPGADSVSQDAMDNVYKKLATLQGQVKNYGEEFVVTTSDINEALDSNIGQTEYFGTVVENTLQRVLDKFGEWGKGLLNNPVMANFVENALKNLGLLTEPQQNIIDIARKVSTANGVAMSSFDLLKISAATNYTDAAKEAKKLSDQAADNILKIHATKMKLIELGWTAEAAQEEAEKYHGGDMTEDELKKYQKTMEDMWKALGGYEKESKKKSGRNTDKELKRWQDLKKAIEDVSTAYDKARKSFSVDESNRQIEKLFGKTFSELGANIKDFYKNGTYDAESLIEALEVLLGMTNATTEERKKFRREMQRKIADTQVEIDVKLKEDSEEQLKKDLDKMFDSYELSKTFKDIGLNVDLTYMVGGKPTTLEDIRRDLNEGFIAAGGKNAPENVVKMYEDAFKKLDDIEHKNQIERIKNYNKYLLESMSERVQIELKAMQDINKIREYETLDAFSKEQAINNRRKKMQEDLTKFDFDQFKGSDVYIDTFKDLEKASKEQLQYVISKLKELQSVNKDLSPVQVKSIASKIRKAQDALGAKTSFQDIGKNLVDSIKYARERNQLLKEQVYLQQQIDAKTKIRSEAEKVLYDLTVKRDSIQDKSSEEWKDANDAVTEQRTQVQVLISMIEELEKKLEGVTKEISAGGQKWINFQGGLKKVNDTISQIKGAADSIFDGLDSMGLVNDAFRDTYESISGIIGGLETTIAGLESIDITKPFSIITGVAKTIGGIFSTIGGFFGIGDKNKERDIKKLQKSIENLDKAYQKLEKSIEATFTVAGYNANYQSAKDNLQKQKSAIEEMKNLEESKKKSDDEKIQEYQEKLEKIAEIEEELRKQRHERFGSTNDVWSAANEWVDAWLTAYKETGDGLDSLNESWDSFYENLVKKQAASAVLGRRMDKYITEINNAIDKNLGSEYSYIDLFKDIGNRMKEEFDATNADLKKIWEYAGIGHAGDLILSDLQKGIQNITEPQAAAIEAYLNSMRFAVFKQSSQLDTLIEVVRSQYGASMENPVVTELKGIRTILDSINERFKSITTSKPGKGDYVKIG